MEKTGRWFGKKDNITLPMLKQIGKELPYMRFNSNFKMIMNKKIFILSFLSVLSSLSFTTEKHLLPCDFVTADAPFPMPPIRIFRFPQRDFPITEYGAVSGGETDNTQAIANAIDACNKAGGGRVVVPAGEWLTGAVHFRSNVNLHLEAGAVLRFTDNPADYLPAVITSWEGMECYNYSPLIYAFECENIAITGKGKLQPKMNTWEKWFARPQPHLDALKKLYTLASTDVPVEQRQMAEDENNLRPHLIHFNRCKNVLLDGFQIRESPFWTIHLYMCNGGLVRNLDVKAHGHNNDGIDFEMSRNFLVENCTFDQGDDAVVIKSGRNRDAWRLNTPCENIVIRNCKIVKGHVLLGIGSEISGGVRNIYMHNCEASDVRRFFFIKTNHRRGGFVENIYMENVKAGKTQRIFEIDADVLYQWKDLVPTYETRITRIEGIHLKNVACDETDAIYEIKGDARLPVQNINIENIRVKKVNKFIRKSQHVGNISEKNIMQPELLPAKSAQDAPREEINFNFGWKFQAGDLKDAQAINYDDGKWRAIDLPHDFQFEQPWDSSANRARGFKTMGKGGYRKTFKANPVWKGKRVLLDFEGIMLTGDAYFNGEKVGGTDYGYLGFEADVTKLVNYEGDNVVAVYADTGNDNNSRWYTGGGLFRDVHLLVKDSISIARNGVFITTPDVSADRAKVDVQVEIEGFRGKSSDLEITVKIFSPDGKPAGETKILAPKRSHKSTDEIPLPEIVIAHPQRWSCETPKLYSAEITLSLNGKIRDKVIEKFGIRTIEYSKEFGFRLNGKKVFLKGISNHHDLGAVGVAAHEFAIERQFKLLKSFGYNHIRCSHNPYSRSFLRLADKYGILITDELFDKWGGNDYWSGRVPFTELWYRIIPEWIKRDRNHPSVIMWSFGNELQIRDDWAGFPTNDWGVTTYRMIDVLAKRYDTTRPTTVAMFPARAGAIGKNEADFNTKIIPPELATVTEISSFNYRWMNYPDYLKHAPDMIIYQSEATTNELAKPFFGMDRDRMIGLAYWGAIEYWGESHGWPSKGWNYSFFNHALEPYPQAYLIKSIFSDEPLVHIGIIDRANENVEWNDVTVGTQHVSSHWNREAGKHYNIFIYTNAEEVELSVNGKSLGVQKNIVDDINRRNMIYRQNVPYQKGKIVAIARTGGKEVARHQLETTGKAVALRMEIENNNWKADGMDLQYVKVYAVDSKGRTVPTSEGELTFDVSGAAKLIAVDNGDHSSDELFDGNKRQLHNGFAMAILRSNQMAGRVKIKASVPGLKSVEKVLETGFVIRHSNSKKMR
jgi:beta-galactosidase